MILHGNQRGGARDLALHLMKPENEHIEVHSLRGFACDDLMGAFMESEAMAEGTRCRQHLFSMSFNPPPGREVSTADFEQAVERAEEALVQPVGANDEFLQITWFRRRWLKRRCCRFEDGGGVDGRFDCRRNLRFEVNRNGRRRCGW